MNAVTALNDAFRKVEKRERVVTKAKVSASTLQQLRDANYVLEYSDARYCGTSKLVIDNALPDLVVVPLEMSSPEGDVPVPQEWLDGGGMTEQDLKAGTELTHKKGGKYRVVIVGTHKETGERMVVYQNREDESKVWVRPAAMFLEPGRFTLDQKDAQ